MFGDGPVRKIFLLNTAADAVCLKEIMRPLVRAVARIGVIVLGIPEFVVLEGRCVGHRNRG